MAQYKTGTVNVTAGSAGVSGSGTAWLAEVNTGDLFAVLGDNCAYEIANVTANGTLGLTEPYRGTTATSKSYLIARDYTPFSGLPYLNEGDLEPHLILKRAMMKLDPFAGGAASENRATAFEVEHNNDGSHKRHALLGTTLDTTGNATVGGTLTLGGVARASWGEPVVAGTATSGAVGALDDTAMDWGTNTLQNMVVAITAGQGTGQVRTVGSNTATQLVPSTNFTTAPNATSTYAVYAMSNQTLSQVVEKEGALGCVGNLSSSALLDLNLAGAHAAMQSLCGREFQFLCESDTTHVDRYGVLQKNPFYSGTPTSTGSNSITDTGASWTVNQLAGDNPYIIYLTDGSHTSYRWVRSNAATQVWWADPVPFTPTSYKISRPRFEENGLLIEGASTNLLTYSEQFDNAAWVRLGMSAFGAGSTANMIAAPDGTITADLLTEDTSTGFHQVSQAATYAPNTTYTTTYQVKPTAGIRYVELILTTGGWAVCRFDLQAATAVTPFYGGTDPFSSGSARIVALADGWYRISLTATSGTTAGAGYSQLRFHNGTTGNYTGDGASGLYVWGAQLEALSFPSSYIPTTNATVTRATTKAAVRRLHKQTADHTWIVDFDTLGDIDYGSSIQGLLAEEGLVYHMIRSQSAGNGMGFWNGDAGIAGVVIPRTTISPVNNMVRLGMVRSGTTLRRYYNGTKYGNDTTVGTSTGTPTGLLLLGRENAGGARMYGHIKTVRVYERALTDVEMRMA